jgi:microcystin degradation protein MlrC
VAGRHRIAAVGIHHESNTFASALTPYSDFEQGGLFRGSDIVDRFASSTHMFAGFLAAGESPGVEVVPVFYADARPSGTIAGEAFDRLLSELLERLDREGPWDAVLLAQHGAAVSEGVADVDGEVVRHVRQLIGPDVPLGVVYDLHANVSTAMIDQATVPVLYRTNPHLDARDRALECAELVVRTLRGEITPIAALETPPLVINILQQATAAEPLAGLYAELERILARAGILTASIALGYPYADVPEMGMSFLAVHNGERQAAADAAHALACAAWERRSDFLAEAPAPDEALREALATDERPVVLLDVGDNIGGGSPGDSTILLAEARRLAASEYIQTIADPEAVEACLRAGPGGRVVVAIGGKTDRLHGSPIEISGRVRLLADGRFEEPGPVHGGYRFFDGGVTAVLEADEGQTLVLTSRPVPATSARQLRSLGIDPETAKIVVAKGVIAPRAGYADCAARFMPVGTDGVTTSDLSRLAYENRRKPLYPFEPDAPYTCG